jgi:hypothetical protein
LTGYYLDSLPKFSAPHPSLDEYGNGKFFLRLPAGSSRSASADHEESDRDQEQNDTDINGADEFNEFR